MTFVYKRGSKFVGLKKRLIESRLNRSRLEQRVRESGLKKWMLRGLESVPEEPSRMEVSVEKEKKKK